MVGQGGLYVTGGAPILNNVFIANNIAYWGGIYLENSMRLWLCYSSKGIYGCRLFSNWWRWANKPDIF